MDFSGVQSCKMFNRKESKNPRESVWLDVD